MDTVHTLGECHESLEIVFPLFQFLYIPLNVLCGYSLGCPGSREYGKNVSEQENQHAITTQECKLKLLFSREDTRGYV